MAIVNPTRTYNTGDELSATYYNEDRDEIIAGINSIDNAQISPSAAIEESKLAFSGAGHDHSGGANGQPVSIVNAGVVGLTAGLFVRVNALGTALETAPLPSLDQVNRAFGFYVSADPLSTGTDKTWNPTVTRNMTVQSLWAYLGTAPSGQDFIIQVKTSLGVLIAELTIPAGSYSASTTTISYAALTAGDVLRLDITQVGSGTAGSKLSVTLEGIQT